MLGTFQFYIRREPSRDFLIEKLGEPIFETLGRVAYIMCYETDVGLVNELVMTMKLLGQDFLLEQFSDEYGWKLLFPPEQTWISDNRMSDFLRREGGF